MIHRAYALSTTEALNAEGAKLRSILSRLDSLSNQFYWFCCQHFSFLKILQRTKQKETVIILARKELVFLLKINWLLMRFGSSYAILAITLVLLCSQFSWAINRTKIFNPKKPSSQLWISSLLFTLQVIRAMQVMSSKQPDAFINAFLSTKIR